LNTVEHPASSNAFDSLDEAYRQSGEKKLAIRSYQTAVTLDPTNGNAKAMLRDLKIGGIRVLKAFVLLALMVTSGSRLGLATNGAYTDSRGEGKRRTAT
jgi:hypothetical protein